MEYKPIRKDLTETKNKCFFCKRQLKSLKAYVLQNIQTGKTVLSGPECAKKHLNEKYSLKGIPDFTKYTSQITTKANRSFEVKRKTTNYNSEEKRPIEYLILREEKLADKMNTSYDLLKNYYNLYLEDNLTSDHISHITNIERKAPEALKLNNLQKCYNYLFWIDIALEKLEQSKRDFLQSIKKEIISGNQLSTKQIKATNNWLEKIDGVKKVKILAQRARLWFTPKRG